MDNRNCLSFWFPKIRDAGLPVPETCILTTSLSGESETDCIVLSKLLDGETPKGWKDFVSAIANAADEVGYPFFLRTGHTSGKHNWERTCFVPTKGHIGQHICALVEWSETVDMMGLPYDVWAVREMLPTNPVCVLPAYGNMPLCREFRCFVRDGECVCVHPYWPWEAVWKGFPLKGPGPEEGEEGEFGWADDVESGRELPDDLRHKWGVLCSMMAAEHKEVEQLAARAGEAVGGYWSVDILTTACGLFVTDMALGEQSFHWLGCSKQPAEAREENPDG